MEVMQILQIVIGLCSGLIIVTGVLFIFSSLAFIEDDEAELRK